MQLYDLAYTVLRCPGAELALAVLILAFAFLTIFLANKFSLVLCGSLRPFSGFFRFVRLLFLLRFVGSMPEAAMSSIDLFARLLSPFSFLCGLTCEV